MPDHLKQPVLIVGTGAIGVEYAKVLADLHTPFIAVGRSASSAVSFEQQTGHKAISGGINPFLDDESVVPRQAIITVSMEQLATVAKALLHKGAKRVLIEKPAGLNPEEIREIAELTSFCNAEVYVAYNRRFYGSVLKAKEIIEADGGVTSFHFEFTEWAHVLSKLNKPKEVMSQIFLGNSTHVVDMAFFLGGKPARLSSFTAGGLDWHPRASVFAGAGVTETGALFSYQANWEAPGRWGLEVLTKKHRLIFRPLEKLAIQNIGELSVHPVEFDESFDQRYKPGFYKQVDAFLHGNGASHLLNIEQHANHVETIYEQILG